MVNKFASNHVKVLLGGQGGDEIFAGYARYLIVYLEQVLLGSINESQDSKHLVNLDTVSKPHKRIYTINKKNVVSRFIH